MLVTKQILLVYRYVLAKGLPSIFPSHTHACQRTTYLVHQLEKLRQDRDDCPKLHRYKPGKKGPKGAVLHQFPWQLLFGEQCKEEKKQCQSKITLKKRKDFLTLPAGTTNISCKIIRKREQLSKTKTHIVTNLFIYKFIYCFK